MPGHLLQDERGNWSTSRVILLGAFGALVVFGAVDTVWHAVRGDIFDALKWFAGGGTAGTAGPRMMAYVKPGGGGPAATPVAAGPYDRDPDAGVEPAP